MSSDNPEQDGAQVIDEENQIDKRLKDRILDARDRVAEREDDIYVEAPLQSSAKGEAIPLSADDLNRLWATPVKQYLKTIEPLLRSDEIANAHHYYHNLPIVSKPITPPDGETLIVPTSDDKDPYTATIRWSQFYTDDVPNRDLIRANSLFGDDFTPPEPRKIELEGLKSIIETDVITKRWHVPLNPSSLPPYREVAQIEYAKPLKKEWLEYAVREADQFLQNAGISLQVGDPTKEADADYSDIEDIDTL